VEGRVRLSTYEALAVLALTLAACSASPPRPNELAALRRLQEPEQQQPLVADESVTSADYEHMVDAGFMLREVKDGWGAHLFFPIGVGFTEFDLSNIALDQLATLAVVPTLELIVPLEERWVLLPSVGLGGAWQLGDNELIGSNHAIGLATASLQTMWWHPFPDRSTVVLKGGGKYSAALTGRDGVLGDWGNVDLAAELRHAFGQLDNEPRFEPGVYAQAFYYWDPVKLDITGVTPTTIDDQYEVGISIGGTSPVRILGIVIPRLFVGYRFGESLQSVQIRLGRL